MSFSIRLNCSYETLKVVHKMEMLGIKWAPLNVPLSRRLQISAMTFWMLSFTLGIFIGVFLEIYLLLFTNYWWLAGIYLLWIYYDRNTSENGGRSLYDFVQKWQLWQYYRNYFPINLTTITENLQLDPARNYLFTCFPHGLICFGTFGQFGVNSNQYKQLFPHHRSKIVTLPINFLIPFYRELMFAINGISSTFQSIVNILQRREGGNIVALIPGGAAEAYYSRPRQHKILLKKRKGFVRVALKTGAPLVPVVVFGEVDVCDQWDGSNFRRFQEFSKRWIGYMPIIPLGRGFFQYSFGILPYRRPITVVVGDPIDVQKIEEPTTEQIDALHRKFTFCKCPMKCGIIRTTEAFLSRKC